MPTHVSSSPRPAIQTCSSSPTPRASLDRRRGRARSNGSAPRSRRSGNGASRDTLRSSSASTGWPPPRATKRTRQRDAAARGLLQPAARLSRAAAARAAPGPGARRRRRLLPVAVLAACVHALNGDQERGLEALRRCAEMHASHLDKSRRLERKLFEGRDRVAARGSEHGELLKLAFGDRDDEREAAADPCRCAAVLGWSVGRGGTPRVWRRVAWARRRRRARLGALLIGRSLGAGRYGARCGAAIAAERAPSCGTDVGDAAPLCDRDAARAALLFELGCYSGWIDRAAPSSRVPRGPRAARLYVAELPRLASRRWRRRSSRRASSPGALGAVFTCLAGAMCGLRSDSVWLATARAHARLALRRWHGSLGALA